MKAKHIIWLSFVALWFQSCSVLSLKLKKVQGHFPGISEAIDKKAPKDIRILIIHGIGPQEENYADKFISRLTKKMGKTEGPPVVQTPITSEGNLGKTNIKKYIIDGNPVTFYAIHWSGITDPYRKLLAENHSEIKGRRAAINNGLKKSILNERLLDFVLFTSNRFKSEIKKPVYATLNQIYEDNQTETKTFNLSKVANSPDLEKHIFLISGSLGSKIVLDVMSNFEMPVGDTLKPEVKNYYKDELKSIFMLSNQVPLLSLSYASKDYNTQEYIYQNYFGVCNFLENSNNPTLNYVSFYDPNDILGYNPIAAEPDCSKNSKCPDCGKKINRSRVILNNTRPLLGILALPGPAHTRVWKNRKLINLVANGSK